jgi:CPA1 family monovalent cation:H+ antiporter
MALSLPRAMPEREVILAMTYVVVAFSILVQGLTVGPLARRWLAGPKPDPAGSPPPA